MVRATTRAWSRRRVLLTCGQGKSCQGAWQSDARRGIPETRRKHTHIAAALIQSVKSMKRAVPVPFPMASGGNKRIEQADDAAACRGLPDSARCGSVYVARRRRRPSRLFSPWRLSMMANFARSASNRQHAAPFPPCVDRPHQLGSLVDGRVPQPRGTSLLDPGFRVRRSGSEAEFVHLFALRRSRWESLLNPREGYISALFLREHSRFQEPI
jgi:hypothetical protein